MFLRQLLPLLALSLLPGSVTADDPRPCTITRDGEALVFKVGDQVVGRYLIDPRQKKPHFHPLLSLGGNRITRAFPMEIVAGESKDHDHHVGLWVGHQVIELEGRGEQKPLPVNFWANLTNFLRQQQGKQVCTKVEEPHNGAGQASVVTHNLWQTTSGTKVLEETRTLRLVDLGTARLILFDLDLHASEGAVTFGDDKDGFFAIRVHDDLAEKSNGAKRPPEKRGGLLENAEGKQHMQTKGENTDRQGCWGLKSDWVDYSGVVEGEKVGVALFDHPSNPVRACWHARDYGLLSANPFGRAKAKFPDAKDNTALVKVPAGERLRFRYAVLVHAGDAKAGEVAAHFRRFIELK